MCYRWVDRASTMRIDVWRARWGRGADARILPFDTSAARRYADLAVKTRAAGKGFPTPDGYIAAIAAAHGFAIASRDTSAFNAAGLTVIDPWTVTSR